MQVVTILLDFNLISALQASYVALLHQSLELFNTAFTAITIRFNILGKQVSTNDIGKQMSTLLSTHYWEQMQERVQAEPEEQQTGVAAPSPNGL